MANLPVKWFSNEMVSSTELDLTNIFTPGQFNDLLTSCLVTGFNITVPTSATYDAGEDEVTLTFASAHGYTDLVVIEVSNADQSQYNGEFRVIDIPSELTLKYKPDTVPAITPATGTIQVKVAPVGWVIIAEDAPNYTKVYGRVDPSATDYYLLVRNDDQYDSWPGNNSHHVQVECVTNFVNFDNFDSIRTFYWPASHYGPASRRGWYFVADPLMLMFGIRYAYYGRQSWYNWGDLNPIKPGDGNHLVWMQSPWTQSTGGQWNNSSEVVHTYLAYNDNQDYKWMATQWHGAPGVVQWMTRGFEAAVHNNTLTFPNAANNSWIVMMHQLAVTEAATIGTVMRGYMPGVVECFNMSTQLYDKLHTQVPGYEGTPLLVTSCTQNNNSSTGEASIVVALDKWREQVG